MVSLDAILTLCVRLREYLRAYMCVYMMAAGGLSADVQSAAAQQLRTWQALGMTDNIAPERLQIYRLLAGQVGAGRGM